MKRIFFRMGYFLVAAVVAMTVAAWWFGFGGPHKELLPPAAAAEGRDPSAVAVTAQDVQFRPVQRVVEAVGTLFGYEEVAVSAKVEGRVLAIHHDVADAVQPNETLLEIDPTDYEMAVRQAQRTLDMELARLGLKEPPGDDFDVRTTPAVMQAAARMDSARTHYDRALAAREGSTREELDEKAVEVRVCQAEYAHQLFTARAELAGLQVKQEALAAARQQLKDAVVRAPVPTLPVPGAESGVTYSITRRAVAEGAYVKSGTEVFHLVIDRTLKLRVCVPEREALEVRLGQKVEMFAAADARPFTGTVTRINPAVDPVNRGLEVEIQVPNQAGDLKPGGFARARILTRLDPAAATVPLEALASFAGVTKVFLTDGKQVKETVVAPGLQEEQWVEIAQPSLPPGARVVTSGLTSLFDGAAIYERSK